MPRTDYPRIAPEGMPWILTALAALATGVALVGWWAGVPLGALVAALVLLFRDPWRDIPAAPLGVLAPVDGVVTEITGAGPGILDREAVRVTMRIHNFGAYTARSPIEGKVLDPRDNLSDHSRWLDVHGMWVRSDEDDDVVVLVHGPKHGPKWFGAPRAFLGYGERVGQGQRFAYMRLARTAEVYLPADAHVRVKTGQKVRAGTDSLAELRHR
ncbi:phosphatidylserine decarboxylase [Lentisalinibacter sediminis]|uniref:hypothetical protein n=2 Tax=Lentisalinibacter sediminis TaxID=2992237 RepID=UPI0038636537